MAVHRMVTPRRDHREGWHDPLRDPPIVIAVLGVAARPHEKTAGALDHLEHGPGVPQVVLIASRALEERVGAQFSAVQKRNVARIDATLHGLQPIAFLHPFRGEALSGWDQSKLPLRQGGLPFRRPHVGPQQASAFDQGIGFELDLLAEAALLRFGGDLDALAGVIVFPAMVGTAQTAFLVAAEPQRHPAMRTKLVNQSIAPLRIPECQESLRQQLDAHRRTFILGQFLGQQRRNPVAAEQPAAGRSRPSLHQQVVLLFPEHGVCSNDDSLAHFARGARKKPGSRGSRPQ